MEPIKDSNVPPSMVERNDIYSIYIIFEEEIVMWNYRCNDKECNIRDGVRAVVIGGCNKGVFLRLEDGQEAFASFGGLVSGTEVFCTVLKKGY